jgi:uncharacterized protein YbbK (DUF523 family)
MGGTCPQAAEEEAKGTRRYGRSMSERSSRSSPHRGWSDAADGSGGSTGDDDRPLVVSACLLGVACNHEGRASERPAVVALGRTRRLIPVCPETVGGLPTPRPAAELQPDERVRTASGRDVTTAYTSGAAHAVALARTVGAAGAVLKARSPSCGCHEVYDGTFTRTRVPGEGVTARALRAAGIPVCSEEDIARGRDPAAG